MVIGFSNMLQTALVGRKPIWFRLVLAGIIILSAGTSLSAQDTSREEFLRKLLPKLSGRVTLRLAQRLGVTEIERKTLVPIGGAPFLRLPLPLFPFGNRRVATDPATSENEPSITVNPANRLNLVAAMHIDPDEGTLANLRCAAFRSKARGPRPGLPGPTPWKGPVFLPLVNPTDDCSDPVIRFSPDGEVVYAAYLSIRADFSTSDVVVSRSFDGGETWVGPMVAIAGVAPDFIDKPWLDVHRFDTTQAARVYVTATIFRGIDPKNCEIAFSGSGDHGESWPSSAAPLILATAGPGCSGGTVADPLVAGSRPIGGLGGNVLACWYDAGAGGWLVGTFDIRCRRSPDNGASFDPEVPAAKDIGFELPYYLCPSSAPDVGFYHRWWPGMFPALAIAPDGSAHLVFTHNPSSGASDGECGDIAYARSSGPPYTTWTLPATISAGAGVAGSAQGFPTITVSDGPGFSRIWVAWLDSRLSPAGLAFGTGRNSKYDVFVTRSGDGGMTFARNERLTDQSSLSDSSFYIGDYIDSAATKQFAHFIWTDRRDKTSVSDGEDDVFSHQIPTIPILFWEFE